MAVLVIDNGLQLVLRAEEQREAAPEAVALLAAFELLGERADLDDGHRCIL